MAAAAGAPPLAKVFVDKSGSTNGHAPYWNSLRAFLRDLDTVGKKCEYFLFDEQVYPVTRKDVDVIASACVGNNGTLTSIIAPYLARDDEVYIVTDGQVAAEEVARCDRELNNLHLKRVHVAFIQTGGPVDLSVSAPFTRNATDYAITKNSEVVSKGRSDQPVDLAVYAAMTPTAFLDAAEALRTLVVMQNMGRTNLKLRDGLLELQKALLARVAAEASADTAQRFAGLRTLLVHSALASLLEMQNIISASGSGGIGARIAGVFQELLHACDSKDFSFAQLAPGRLARATAVVAQRTEELPLPEQVFAGFECPITLDAAIPVCLVAAGAPVLEGVEKHQVEAILTNPLFLLLDPMLVTRVRARLDSLVGLETAKELAVRHMDSPLTRRPIAAVLAFGRETEHIKATDYALANILFGSKLVGQPDLWVAVLYFIIADPVPSYLNRETAFVAALKDHLFHRMRRHWTNLTLTGLPVEPLLKAPVDIAVWYCVVSPYLCQHNADKDKDGNRLRAFGGTALYLMRLLDEVFEYQYERKETRHWCALYKAFAWMMREAKDPKSQWRVLLRAQVQKSMTVVLLQDPPHVNHAIVGDPSGTVAPHTICILLDGPATDATRPALPDFAIDGEAPTLAELFALANSYVDVNKTVGAVFIPRQLPLLTRPAHVYNYCYAPGVVDSFTPELSPLTFRPVVMDRVKHKEWLECAQERLGITDMRQQLSMYKYMISFVHEHGAYPSRDAYIEFVARKQAAREDGGARDTLPEFMAEYTAELFANFETVLGTGFGTVPAAEFVRVTRASMPRDVRGQMDGSATPV